jgi:hypothetical protein
MTEVAGMEYSQGKLHEVLREALVLAEAGPYSPENDEQVSALREVARRRRGEPFSLEPVAVEMVEAVLRTLLGAPSGEEQAWGTVSRAVAETLCDHPASEKRLRALWERLGEGVGL